MNSDREGQDEKYKAPRLTLSLADFELLRRIGDGSYSQVVLARHKATGKEYALKVIDKHYILRHKVVEHVKRERALLDRLSYDGIVRLYFTFQDALSLYMGLEHCPNGELYDQIRMAGRLEEEAARFYAAEVVLMLEYLRAEGVVHRDIKPENLLLTDTGHLRLIDFGSAKQLPLDEVLPPLPAQPSGAASEQQQRQGRLDQQQQQEGGGLDGARRSEGGDGNAPIEAPASSSSSRRSSSGAGAGDSTGQPGRASGGFAPSSPGNAAEKGGPQGAQHADLRQQHGQQQNAQHAQRAHQEQREDGGAEAGGGDGGGSDSEGEGGSTQRAVSLVGTADYVSPEILRNERCSCASDLWALGCVIYQMLVGKAPFKSPSEYLTFQKILEGSFSVPGTVSREASDLIQRLLRQQPAQRIGSLDFSELKSHSFFSGIDWAGLRAGPAPRFVKPELDSIDSDTGSFDWELQSLSAALPHISHSNWQYEPTDSTGDEE